jgi:hypothetical protein
MLLRDMELNYYPEAEWMSTQTCYLRGLSPCAQNEILQPRRNSQEPRWIVVGSTFSKGVCILLSGDVRCERVVRRSPAGSYL